MPLELLAIFDPADVQRWIATGGYYVLFAVLFGCGLGLPVPEDIPLIIAGYFIADGSMTWLGAGIVCWCGIIGGDLALYHIARRYGHNITRVPFIGTHINAKRLAQLEGWFEKYGIWVVALGRLVAGVRGAMVVAAGTIRYSRVKFVIADGIAALISGGLFMLLGHYLGKKLPFPELIRKFEQSKEWVTVGLLIVVAGGVAWWWFRRKKRKAINEAVIATEHGTSTSTTVSDTQSVTKSVTVTTTIPPSKPD